MGHHEEGGGVEALDEEAALVVERRVGRAADRGHPLGVEPVAGRPEQATGRRGVVIALEKPEKTPILPIPLDMPGIDDAGDSPDVDPTA